MARNSTYMILCLCCIPLFFLNVHNSHPWGDDYAQYVKEGLNFATGHPFYQSNCVFNELNTDYAPPQYPPGFPLLLSPVIKVWGIAIKPMLYLNSFLLSCMLFAFFGYFKKHTSHIVAICISLIGIYSGFLLDVKKYLYSDMPCTLFVSLYYLLRNNKKLNIVLLVTLATISILIRTQAILIILAELIFFVLQIIKTFAKTKKITKNDFFAPSFYISIFTIIIYFLFSHFVFYSPASTFGYYVHMAASFKRTESSFIDDLYYYKSLFGSIFWYPYSHSLTDPFVNVVMDVTFFSCCLGFLMTIKKRLAAEDIFFILMSLLVFIVPVRQGFRLLLPALMFILLYCYKSMSVILSATIGLKGYGAALFLSFFYLLSGHNAFKFSLVDNLEYTPYDQDSREIFSYLKNNIKDSGIIIFPKARALTLYTNKKSMVAAPQLSYEDNKKKFQSVKAKYLLINKNIERDWYFNYITTTQAGCDSVKVNSTYTLYLLHN